MRGIGTSQAVGGPRGTSWREAERALRRWEPAAEDGGRSGQETAEAYRRALASTLRRDPDAFGIRDGLRAAGERLVEVLESLDGDVAADRPSPGRSPQEDTAFAAWFRGAVAGEGATLADAAIRRAAIRGGLDRLFVSPDSGGLSDELFCLIYGWFFADAVAEFVKTLMAEKIKLVFPVLYAVDPAGLIAGWLSERIYAELPKPCEAKDARGEDAPSLGSLARDLLDETVDRSLGLSYGQEASA